MAIAAQIDFKGATLDQYDQALAKMGMSHGGPGGPGGLFHWMMKTDDGIRATDVWESQEAFDRFAQERMGPITRELGFPPPQIQIFEVHNYLTAG